MAIALSPADGVDPVDPEQPPQAARIVGSGQPAKAPELSLCGGLVTAMEPTPAICAGTTFMTTLLG